METCQLGWWTSVHSIVCLQHSQSVNKGWIETESFYKDLISSFQWKSLVRHLTFQCECLQWPPALSAQSAWLHRAGCRHWPGGCGWGRAGAGLLQSVYNHRTLWSATEPCFRPHDWNETCKQDVSWLTSRVKLWHRPIIGNYMWRVRQTDICPKSPPPNTFLPRLIVSQRKLQTHRLRKNDSNFLLSQSKSLLKFVKVCHRL